ncbi:MAG: aspartate carbamoyltransferase catalytic subunit [Syntrophobacterales bacterium]|jgi:aspartate carbamoyltransferase catalytic subunit|nr:aspartate carbamoyltransferase catalytic subunit [Syntrophobacterales bacterium]
MKWNKKDILGIKELSPDEIQFILDTADSFVEISTRDIKKVPTLRGKTIINFFVEASTRTRTSFEIAGKRLSADTVNISPSSSSLVKGETLLDTARNLEAMSSDIVVIRHHASGVPHMIAKHTRSSIINAGDGTHEHPTQALLDMMTIQSEKGSISGLKIAIVGDIFHSRVARSNILGMTKMGADVHVAGPATMLPPFVDQWGVSVHTHMDDAIRNADVIMMLRIQTERENQNIFPSLREYSRYYCLNSDKVKLARQDVMVMHPGPMNRGVEISSDVADGVHSVILKQVAYGIALRMALLYLLAGETK